MAGATIMFTIDSLYAERLVKHNPIVSRCYGLLYIHLLNTYV
jgi:hypothetical protein